MNVENYEAEWLLALDKFNKLHAKYKVPHLPRPEYMLLHLIAGTASGAVKISELATDLGVTMPAVSKLLKTLEEKHAISRVNDITDRRITYITMTKTGRRIYDNASQELRYVGLCAMELMGEQDFDQTFQLLSRLYAAFEAAFESGAERLE